MAVSSIVGECDRCGAIDRLVYDHCHKHGQWRGFVCYPCNNYLSPIDRANGIESYRERCAPCFGGQHDDYQDTRHKANHKRRYKVSSGLRAPRWEGLLEPHMDLGGQVVWVFSVPRDEGNRAARQHKWQILPRT